MSELEASLARLSGDEIVSALHLGGAPRSVQAAARRLFSAISTPLGRVLARFDADIAEDGASRAAAAALSRLGARVTIVGPRPPARGALLVVSNHPGAYDALSLLAATGRDDVAVLAADRPFLRAMPSLADHLVFVPDSPAPALDRTRAARRALAHLAAGGALLHFGAGQIEPDPGFAWPSAAAPLAAWAAGTGALVRGAASAEGWVSAAIVEGVHSRRAKRLPLTRLAERHGVTTLAPLLQVSLRAFRDVDVTVRFADSTPARQLTDAGGSDSAITARVRDRAASLLAPPRRR